MFLSCLILNLAKRWKNSVRGDEIPNWNVGNTLNAVLSLGRVDVFGNVLVHVLAVHVDEGDGELLGVGTAAVS